MSNLVHKRAAVIHPMDGDGRVLLRHLRRTGLTAEMIWPPPSSVPKGNEFALILVDRDQPSVAVDLFDGFDGVSVAIIDAESPIILDKLTASNVHGILTKPIRNFGILAQLTIAASLHGYSQRLTARVDHVEGNLRARRVIEKATSILMRSQGLDMDSAYEELRGRAMRQRRTVGMVAADLVDNYTEPKPPAHYRHPARDADRSRN